VSFTCGRHRAFVYERGGVRPVGELTPMSAVRWNRKRDEISDAEATIGTTQCCELLGDLRTAKHELHIQRDGEDVWEGVITRLEYEWDAVRVYAEDMLWVAKRTVLKQGYKQGYPNLTNVVTRMDWLLRSQTYAANGDPWRMVSHLHPVRHDDEPMASRDMAAFQTYTWDDFDKYAEDSGTDYTVVNRDIYYWDLNLRWKVIPPLDEQFLSQFPRVVEYGNQAATRGYVSNTEGYAGTAEAPQAFIDEYGYIDWLITNLDDTQDDGVPTDQEIANWAKTAGRNINGRYPPPLAIVIPANTTLLPGAPWEMSDLFPGAWFRVHTAHMCRQVDEWQRIHDISVEESAPQGETVNFTATSAPGSVVEPEGGV
jgi:hypothetical protein